MLNPLHFRKRSAKWEKPYFGAFTIVKRINDINHLVRKGPSVPAFIAHVDKLKKYVCDVPNARVSVVCRKMRHRYYCPSCEYETSNGRSIRRHAIGHHNSEWRGLGRPLCPIPSERLPQARETLRRLQMNSRQRRREADRHRSGVPLVATLRAASPPQDDVDNSGCWAAEVERITAERCVRGRGRLGQHAESQSHLSLSSGSFRRPAVDRARTRAATRRARVHI